MIDTTPARHLRASLTTSLLNVHGFFFEGRKVLRNLNKRIVFHYNMVVLFILVCEYRMKSTHYKQESQKQKSSSVEAHQDFSEEYMHGFTLFR